MENNTELFEAEYPYVGDGNIYYCVVQYQKTAGGIDFTVIAVSSVHVGPTNTRFVPSGYYQMKEAASRLNEAMHRNEEIYNVVSFLSRDYEKQLQPEPVTT